MDSGPGSAPPRRPSARRSSREYFTVDLRGLRAALTARAAAEVMTESDVLRSAFAATLGPTAQAACASSAEVTARRSGRRSVAKLSVRVTHLAASRLDQNARTAGMSRGAYLTRLIEGAATVVTASDRSALAKALSQSAEELAVLSRDIHHLTALLRQGSVRAAHEYRSRLENLDADVRTHLERSGKVLAALSAERSTNRTGRRAVAPGSPVLP